ncbi:nitric oxide synthase [Oxalobacteraceae bacterium CAVE-383]|nr:nitric oxide synthase [Oxalobacteraceae bacterium CAVE-383]
MGLFKKILFQIHWFVGITAGTLLMMVGVTGAMLSFSEEIIEALNPDVLQIVAQPVPKLDAPQLIARIQGQRPESPISSLVLTADPAGARQVHPARVMFAAPPGQKRGEMRYVDPYNAQLLPMPRAEPFFKWIEFLHRFLLLPTPAGKVVMGSAAMCLLFLALSGLYLRWPRQALQWRAWFRLDFSLRGRSFLWHLHSMIGTWALAVYVISASTGVYWSFDWVKKGVDGMLGQTQAQPRPQAPKKPQAETRIAAPPKSALREPISPEQATRIWQAFSDAVPAYRRALFRFPERANEAVQVTFLDADAPHDQAQSRLRINPENGAVSQRQDYRDKDIGGRLTSAVYPLHMGTYFGLPGRIVMTIGALCLPLFGITGWMLYLDRRRKKRAVARARRSMQAGAPAAGGAQEKILLVFASQSGYAERIALNTAAALQAAGLRIDLQSAAATGVEQLRHYHRVLFVASTFGDGEPPDSARGFTRQLMHQPASLAHLRYGVLALGDRHYRHFCGYGHTLDYHLQAQGAQPDFALIEVDNGDSAALTLWQHALADCCGIADLRMPDAGITTPAVPAPYHQWQLLERRHLNPGSLGEPIFHLALAPHGDAKWQSGALVEILPRQAPRQVEAFLRQNGLDGAAPVRFLDAPCTLAEALARAVLPAPFAAQAPAPQALADTLKLPAPRRYSVASIAEDGSLQLLVRQSLHDGGMGLASGWLTAHAAPGGAIEGRLLDNPSFALSGQDVPGIFIGNGSGMAGLRSHLKARARDGRRRNWLLFGERNLAHDALYADEIAQWQKDGFLERVDLAFSRDQAERIYVQDKLRDAAAQLRAWLAHGAVIYVCGSMEGMAAGVDAVLNDLLGDDGLEELIAANRYRRDIY